MAKGAGGADRGSNGGLSRFQIPNTAGEDANESGIPQDKIYSPKREEGENPREGEQQEDSREAQAMYDQFMGSSGAGGQSPGATVHGSKSPAGYPTAYEQDGQPEQTTLIYNPTINQQIRNRALVRDKGGVPVIKNYKRAFVQCNPSEARASIREDGFTMHENEYNLAWQAKIDDYVNHKKQFVGGEFKRSFNYDNATNVDWNKSTRERKTEMLRTDQLKRNTLRSTADTFMSGTNGYKTFLADVEELPRLSILDNYKRIKQIMNANYVKGISVEKKYRNRTKQDLEADEEYAKWREEETNSKKMSTILRSLNTTNYKKKLPVAASAQPKTKIR